MTAQKAPVETCVQAQKTLMTQTKEAETLMQSACSECKRRKQKCSRYWPCQHCGTRRVGNHCIFQTVLEVKTPEERQAQIQELVDEMEGSCFFSHAFNEEMDDDSADTAVDLEALGYSTDQVVSRCSRNHKWEQSP
ncbi:hypothetical protein J3F83DRAFT_714610 [Trichoderma novae-zelandiae]